MTFHSIRMPTLRRFGLIAAMGVAVAMAAPLAVAQTAQPAAPAAARPAAPALTPEQQAAMARQDADMKAAASQVVQLIDANRAGEVWDGASAVMKRVVSRQDFVNQIAGDRQRLGAAQQRGQPVVSRAQFPAGAQVPEGLYINIATPTRFAGNQQPIRELVSFRLDEDRTWRVSGYSTR